MYRHVTSLPIPNEFKSKLVKNGVESLNELANLKPTDLIKDFGFSKNDVADLNETLNLYQTSTKPLTLYDLLKEQEQRKHLHLSTLSKSFDEILGGGIPLGKITEICGVAGVGKTQICMQMCVNVQIPEKYGGLGGKAIYIDTEGSFISKRVVEIANAVIDLVAKNQNLSSSDGLFDNSLLFLK
jgi:RAD51-like protein 2